MEEFRYLIVSFLFVGLFHWRPKYSKLKGGISMVVKLFPGCGFFALSTYVLEIEGRNLNVC